MINFKSLSLFRNNIKNPKIITTNDSSTILGNCENVPRTVKVFM